MSSYSRGSGVSDVGRTDGIELSFRRVTPSRHITISDLRAADGRLYFGSIASGKDEAHAFDLASGREWRISTSAFGSFQPAASRSGRVAMTTYDRHGYHLAVQDIGSAVEQAPRELPLDIVNPPWKRWDLPKMDDIVYPAANYASPFMREGGSSPADGQTALSAPPTPPGGELTTFAESRAGTEVSPLPASGFLLGDNSRSTTPKRYRKALNLLRPHSWLPLDFYPPDAIQESDLTMNLGATVMSQSLLSDMTSWLAVGWRGGKSVKLSPPGSTAPATDNLSRGAMLRGGLSYSGLGPVLEVDFTWGGAPQTAYTSIPAAAKVERKKYFGVTTRLSVPMTLSSGYWNSSLVPSAEWFYTNGLIFKYTPSYFGSAVGTMSGTLTRGVDRLTLGLAYGGQVRTAPKEFLPRWGVVARVNYVTNPTNRDFHNLLSTYVAGYLPGVVRPHSLMVRGAWQQTVGGRDDAMFSYRRKELFPRGAAWDFSPRRMVSGSIDYQLPVWYPEGGWASVIYFKRVRLNLFYDVALWDTFPSSRKGLSSSTGGLFSSALRMSEAVRESVYGARSAQTRTIVEPDGFREGVYSVGGEVILDISPFRTPASTNMSVRFTVAKPSDSNGVFLGVGLSLPL